MNAEMIVCLVMGVIIGFIVKSITSTKTIGTLLIDTTDPEKDMYSLQIDSPIDKLPKMRSVKLKIKVL